MGVPAFFKWLMKRYPKIVIEAREELNVGFNLNQIHMNNFGVDERIPPIDNLYFDMNGIIHPCAHPEDRESPSSLAEMFNSIFDYCDKIIRIIRPRKLIYMAIDGVAPRAKMNQQRSRRFRAALSAQQNERVSSKIEKEWKDKGLPTDFLDKQKKEKFKFDSNCITPGTDFLKQCSIAVRAYIKSRLNNDPLWSNLNVVFSDASVPGEGEHKILDFIRTQRTYETYDPNTYHCIYGADADLIMLSLIMHEPHFCVIRESLSDKFYMVCDICGKHGHQRQDCDSATGKFVRNKATKEEILAYNREKINEIEFSLIKIGILREYLELEFKVLLAEGKDLERIIDDFVFLCFLVGNDFLPNMPSLKIREGAIDAMVYLYKKIRPQMNDYLTNGKGQLNLNECETLFKFLSRVEDKFFRNEMEIKIRENERKKINDSKKKPNILSEFRSIPNINKSKEEKHKGNNCKKKQKNNLGNNDEIDLVNVVGNINSIEKDENLQNHFNLENLKLHGENVLKNIVKEAINEESKQKVSEYVDNIKLGEIGWKDRYYMEKFHVSSSVNKKALIDLKQKVKQYYIEGLCWVFEYYYNGCISWSWFYPFHYAPFASDLIDLNSLKINFDLNKPFLAFEQLLSVLPPYSAEALPIPFRKLMTDPLSPISDFYPSNIKLDINNQPFEWMGVNLLPFIDADRVQKVVKKIFEKGGLSDNDKKLNERGENILITTDAKISEYFQGKLCIHKIMNTFGKSVKDDSEIKGIYPGDIKKDKCQVYIFYKKPTIKNHSSQILEGVRKEPKCVFEDNLDTYNKSYFNGKRAIEIVQEELGTQYDDVESRMIMETFDAKYGNNNIGIPDDPKLKFLWMKKRERENESKLHSYKEINKEKNNQVNRNIHQNLNIQKEKDKNNELENKKEENVLPLDEEEHIRKENAKTKKKKEAKKENKDEKKKKDVDIGLFNKLTEIMNDFNNFKKKKN